MSKLGQSLAQYWSKIQGTLFPQLESELRWKNGRRVYYAEIPERNILLLLGGNKNGQDKDIHQAKKLFDKYVSTDKEK
jgi:putative addiction module killer protein